MRKRKGQQGGKSTKVHRRLNGRVNAEREGVRTTARKPKNKEQEKRHNYIERREKKGVINRERGARGREICRKRGRTEKREERREKREERREEREERREKR